MNFLYDEIVQALQTAIDWCTGLNSATDRRGYVLERRFTKFSEITKCNGYYAIQGHLGSPILVPIKAHIYDFLLVINTNYLLSCTVSKLWLIIGQMFTSERGVPQFNALARAKG